MISYFHCERQIMDLKIHKYMQPADYNIQSVSQNDLILKI